MYTKYLQYGKIKYKIKYLYLLLFNIYEILLYNI